MSVIDSLLPAGWSLATLGECLEWGSGGTPLRSHTEFFGGDIPWAIIGDLTDGPVSSTASTITELGLRSSAARWVPTNSVLLAMYGSIGKLGINTSPLTTNQAIAFTQPSPIDSKYLFYYLMSARSELIAQGQGGTQSNISQTLIKQFPFVVAPLPEQHRIVEAIESYFTRLDDAVATLERVQRNLKRYRASVLKAAVEGRLVPTEAELARAEGRDYESALVLVEPIARTERHAEDNLPEVPEGWRWSSIGEVGDVSGGLTQNAKRNQLPNQLPFLRVANVYANELRLEQVNTIGVLDSEIDRVRLERGDLLVVEGNGSLDQIGRVAIWDGSIDPCLHQNHLIKVRLGATTLSQWALLWLLSPRGRRTIEQAASSTSGLHTLSLSKIARMPIPIPPIAEQSRIVAEVNRLLTISDAAETDSRLSITRCARLRQSILKWAFEGRLVDQEPSDESASVLLERIRAQRAERQPSTRAKSRRSKSTSDR